MMIVATQHHCLGITPLPVMLRSRSKSIAKERHRRPVESRRGMHRHAGIADHQLGSADRRKALAQRQLARQIPRPCVFAADPFSQRHIFLRTDYDNLFIPEQTAEFDKIVSWPRLLGKASSWRDYNGSIWSRLSLKENLGTILRQICAPEKLREP